MMMASTFDAATRPTKPFRPFAVMSCFVATMRSAPG